MDTLPSLATSINPKGGSAESPFFVIRLCSETPRCVPIPTGGWSKVRPRENRKAAQVGGFSA